MKSEIRSAEYRFTEVTDEPGVWSAPNRSQELRSRISSHGIEVFPRSAPASGVDAEWTLALGTRSFGREGDERNLAPGSLKLKGARAELERDALTEWFENSEDGIEHGWTIVRRPGGIDPLLIGLAIAGELSLRLDEGARSGVFVDAGGAPQLRYGGLVAWDATGRALDARLVSTSTGAAIRVVDAAAVYPLTIDPLITAGAWTAESNQAGAGFGVSVSTAGDVNGDGFCDVIVGAYFYDGGNNNEGRAYVYHGSATGLASSAAWTDESDQDNAWFGASVAFAGDVNGDGYSDVVVGAYQYENGETKEGGVFVYHGSAGGLSSSPDWTAESNQADAQFGISTSTAGDVNGDGYSDLVVGAFLFDDVFVDEGRAFVYLGSASGLAATAAWTVGSGQLTGRMGYAVSTAGDVNGDGYADVIVSADRYDAGQVDEGRAFVFHGSATGLGAVAAWTGESNQVACSYGVSVSTAGDVNGDGYADVVVGATRYANGQTKEGRAYVYHGSAGGLAVGAAWTVESNEVDAQLGNSVSTAGDVNGDGYSDLLVGAFVQDNGEVDEGVVYLYEGSSTGLSTIYDWVADADQAGARMGISVSTAGDVNGDGYADVIVGAYRYDAPEADEGRAFVYHGSAAGLAASEAWTAESNQVNAEFGYSVSTAGDVNGDGYSDVIVGVRKFDNGESNEGRAYVYHGSATGLNATPAWTAESNQAGANFGSSVSTAGDVNGDGYSDVIVGAPLYDNGESDEGRAYVYHGSAAGLGATEAWTAESNQTGANFGGSVSSAGDVNGDGYSDVIVGAYCYGNGESQEGRAYVYQGSATGLETTEAWIAESNQGGAKMGISVSTAGDVNGDGYSDVIVGAYNFANGQSQEGRAFIYHGSATGLSATEAWTAESNQVQAQFGSSVSTAGDVNGDGYSDVIVGAYFYSNGEMFEGRAFVYYGNDGDGGLLRSLQQRRATNARPIALLGTTTSAGVFRLRVKVDVGAAGFDWATPLPTLAFLEWEVKLLGEPFDGKGLERSAVGKPLPLAGGATLVFNELVVPKLPGGKKIKFVGGIFHWRARLVTTNPLFPCSAWFSAPGNSVTETKLRQP